MVEISIIVPVYKVEQYLCRCLDSIVAQTFTDWECILVDDGSPDDSGTICDEYAENDKRFRVFHQENAGVSAARNKGLDEAKGEWICFVDSDDWIEKEMLEKMYNLAVKNKAEVVVCGCKMTDTISIEKKFNPKIGWLNIPVDFVWYMHGPWSKLFNRMAIENIRFPLNITLGEDLYFVFQVFAFHTKTIFGMDSSFYNYFVNPNSVTKTISTKNILDHMDVNAMIEKDLSINGFYNDNQWQRWLQKEKANVKDNIFRMKQIDFQLWWKIYPELNYNFGIGDWKSKVLKLLMIFRLYPICRCIINWKRKRQSF